MDKIYNEYFDETYYVETLENGLKLIVFHKPEYASTIAAFGTAYGALDLVQKFKDKEYSFDPGVAHFLEHKLFESEEKNIFNLFSDMGCAVNAFTSYKETVYHFSTTNKDIKDALKLLLDFVQDLSITEASVEKEKGIIIEELAMYMQEADSRLLDETYKSLYHSFPLKYDIGGDRNSVMAINKDELEECYKINYHPSNMALVLVSPIDPYVICQQVINNQSKKSFNKEEKPFTVFKEEPLDVVRKEYSFEMPINKSKHVYAIKLRPDFKDNRECSFKEWCLNIYLKAYFSPLNPDYQKWLDEGLINDYFGYEVDLDMDYANILFYSEGDMEDLRSFIDGELKKDRLNEELLKQIKRRYIGISFRVFNDIEHFATGFIRDLLNGHDFFENINILNDITLKDIKAVYEGLDLSHYTLTHVFPSGK